MLRCSVFAVARHLMNFIHRRHPACVQHTTTVSLQHVILQLLNQPLPIHRSRQEVPLLDLRVAILHPDDVPEGSVSPVAVEQVQDRDLLLIAEYIDGGDERHRRDMHVLEDEDAAKTEPASVPRVDAHAVDTLQRYNTDGDR